MAQLSFCGVSRNGPGPVDRRFSSRSGLFVLAFLLACSEPQAAEPALPPVLGPLEAPARAPDPVETEDSQAAAKRRFGTVALHAGFNPDPHVVHGTAKGEVSASSIHEKCEGWISEKPDYLLDSETAFFRLYILARAEDDIALVVRDPDGKVLCNRDRKGTNSPRVHADLPLGTTELWVSVKRKGAQAPYNLGFSEVSWKPSTLPAP